MFKFSKAATIAAVSVTLVTAVISADAGFAFGADQSSTALKADTIQIDPTILSADLKAAEAVKSDALSIKVGKQGDIIFVPGRGANAPLSLPVEDREPVQDEGSASSLSELVRIQDTDVELEPEQHCLAGAVFFESKGESLAGQLAVARVVLERAKSGRFPSSVCGVVYQKSQFSFVRGNSMPHINKSKKSWKTAVAISQIAMDQSWESPVEGALFFHARRVSPGWRLTRLGTVDNHIFYR